MRRALSWGRECQAVPAGDATKGREVGLIPPTLKFIPVVELPAVSSNPDTPIVLCVYLQTQLGSPAPEN